MTQARPIKPTSAICQPDVEIKVWASGDAITRPIDPAAEIAPMVTLRLAADTARADTVMLMLDAVHDSAIPTQIPAPKVKASAVVEKIMVTRPRM